MPKAAGEASTRSQRQRELGVALAVVFASVLLIEVLAHGPFAPREPFAVALLSASLLAVVFAAFSAGITVGLVAAGVLGVYALHFFSPHEQLTAWGAAQVESAVILAGLGALTAIAVGVLKRRADRLAGALLERERAHAAELEHANRELLRANEALEAFSFVVSHDLKEPVRAVGAYLEAAREDMGTPDAQAHVERAETANRRLADLIARLLDWSRTSMAPLELEVVRVREVLDDPATSAQFDRLMEERHAEVEVDDEIPSVLATRTLVAQVFGNLVVNALKHNDKPAPWVRVGLASATDDEVRIVVEDNGPGFSPRMVERFQTEVGMRPGGGKGFGLAIARRGVERAGGRIDIESRDGGGAAVIVTLPRASADEGPSALNRRAARLV